jgi:hypothetical protein
MRPEEMTALDADMSEKLFRSLEEWPTATVEQVRNAVLEARMIVPAWHARNSKKITLEGDAKMFASLPGVFEEAIAAGRLFDFGFLPNAVIGGESGRAATLFEGGHIGHPFRSPYCIFHRWEGGGSLYVVDPADWHTMMDGKVPPGSILIAEAQAIKIAGKGSLLMGDCAIVATDAANKRYGGIVIASAMHGAAEDADGRPPPTSMGNLIEPVMTGLLLLNTDGVPVDRIAAPERLNKARAKNRKPAIPAHWHVHCGDYVTALTARRQPHPKGAPAGHHASPVPHLRRGHVRHKAAYHGGGTVFVRDAVVNLKEGREESVHLGRSFYQRTDR